MVSHTPKMKGFTHAVSHAQGLTAFQNTSITNHIKSFLRHLLVQSNQNNSSVIGYISNKIAQARTEPQRNQHVEASCTVRGLN